MAVLEKIRSKSVMLFTIIIVALLAFIMGDFFNSGCSRHGDTVAKANGVKVKYNEYNLAREANSALFKQQIEMARQQNPYVPGYNEDVVSEYTIFSLLTQGLMAEEYDRMGIDVTDAELSAFNLDPKNATMVMSMVAEKMGADPRALAQLGITTPATLLDAIEKPNQYNLDEQSRQMLETAWKNYEVETTAGLKRKLYLDLLGGLFTANKIDARNTYDDRNTTTTFQCVAVDFASVADDKVKLTDADYQAAYDQFKGMFKIQEPKRYISYITLGVSPSENDRKKMDDDVQALIADLSSMAGDSAMTRHNTFTPRTAKLTRANITADDDLRTLTATIDSMIPGTVRQTAVLGNHYAVAKLLERSSGIDSVTFTLYPVPEVAKLDSIAATFTAANIDSLAGPNSTYTTSLINPIQGLTPRILAQLETAPLDQIITFTDTIQGQQGPQPTGIILKVDKRSQPVPVFEILVASADLIPSDATISELSQSLRNYVANNGTAEAFGKNAAKAGFTVNKALVSASDPIGAMAPNSLTAVRWAMLDAKEGQVSGVFSLSLPEAVNGSSQYFLAVAVDEAFDGDYMPVASQYVKAQLKDYCTAAKKTQLIGDMYKAQAASLEQLAAKAQTSVTGGSSSFGAEYIMGKYNPDLQAAVATAQPGKVVGPIRGTDGAYYVKVLGSKTEGRPYQYRESANMFLSRVMRSFVDQNIKGEINPSFNLLRGDSKIDNYLLDFTRAE